MEREDRLVFCRKCKNRKFDPMKGIVCGLTNEKGDFEEQCSSFAEDPGVVNSEAASAASGVGDEVVVRVAPGQMELLKRHEGFGYALAGGMLAVLISAALWAAITVATKYQIGYMAIGVGLLVGFTVRFFGIGFTQKFGVLGGLLALLGCLLGNLFSYVGISAEQMGVSFWAVLPLLQSISLIDIYVETFSPMDVLFYGIAIYEGYRFSFTPITPKLVSELGKEGIEELPARYRLRLPLAVSSVVIILGIAYFASGEANLTFTNYYDSGQKSAEGTFREGKEEGEWKYWDEEGHLFLVGYFKSGQMDSLWVWYNEAGQIVRKGEFKRGLEHGVWQMFYPDGSMQMDAWYVNGRLNGEYFIFHENGLVAQKGRYERDLQVGPWRYYHESGQLLAEGSMVKGNREGRWCLYYSNGGLQSEMEYRREGKDCLIWQSYDTLGKPGVVNGNGRYREFSSDKVFVKEGNVKEGWPVGEWRSYAPTGKLTEVGKYVDNEYLLEKYWDEKGKLCVKDGNGQYVYASEDGRLEGAYKNGRKEGMWKTYYFPSEALASEMMYKDGKEDGMQVLYYESGKVQTTIMFRDGVLDGESKWYYEDGMLSAQVMYRDGKKEGQQQFWDEEGNLVRVEYYENGEFVREEVL